MNTACSSPTNNHAVANGSASDATTKAQQSQETRKLRPLADVFESETAYKIKLDLVAVNREEIAISLERDTLKVSARRASSDANASQAIVYEREFTLPVGVDRDGVSASYKAGVLDVVIPKQASERPRRVAVAVN